MLGVAGKSDEGSSDDDSLAPKSNDLVRSREKPPLAIAMHAFMDSLPPQKARQLMEQMRFLSRETISVGTACSGTDVAVLALRELLMKARKLFGVKVSVRHLFSCESDPHVQDFLVEHHPGMEALVGDMKFLDGDSAPTVKKGPPGNSIMLGTLDLFMAGFVCKARSKVKPGRARPTCIRDGTGTSTGLLFFLLGAVDRGPGPLGPQGVRLRRCE